MKRKQRFMKHPIQAKYLWTVVAAMLAPALVLGFCFYHLVFRLMAEQMAFPEAILSNITPVIERVNVILWIAMPVLAALIFWAGLVVSHRFAGPIERLESELDRALEGQAYQPIRLRESDDLKGVADRINRLMEKTRR
jgi:methyl-accepting chemotaxis protein